MRCGMQLALALLFLVLVIFLIAIVGTYTTFITMITTWERIFMNWGALLLEVSFFVLGVVMVLSAIIGIQLLWIFYRLKHQKLYRFAPSEQGYYEAFLTEEGFIKPEDNIILQVPHTYSPHINNPKQEPIKPQGNEEEVIDLWENGQTLRSISEATGKSYYQIQKITSREKKKKRD